MRRQNDGYSLGQKFFNPDNRNTWIIYCIMYDELDKDWRYNLIMGNSSQPRVIEQFGTQLKEAVKRRKLELK